MPIGINGEWRCTRESLFAGTLADFLELYEIPIRSDEFQFARIIKWHGKFKLVIEYRAYNEAQIRININNVKII